MRVIGIVFLIVIVGLVLSCETAEETPGAAEEASVQEGEPQARAEEAGPEAGGPDAVRVAEDLKEGGLPITHPITPTEEPMTGLISSAVTASDSVEISVYLFASPEARQHMQEQRAQNLQKARTEMEPGALPDFIETASCGPILVELTQLSDSGEGREQHGQAQRILEERFGPCETR